MTQNNRIILCGLIYSGQFVCLAMAAAAILHMIDVTMCLRAEKRRVS